MEHEFGSRLGWREILVILAIGTVVLWCLCGCGAFERATALLSGGSTGAPAVKPEPVASPDLQEALRQQTQYGRDVLEAIYQAGADAKNAAVGQAHRGMDLLLAYTGSPVKPIPVQSDLSASPEQDKFLTEAYALLADLRAAQDKWKAGIADAATKPTEHHWWISSPYLFWGGVATVFLAVLGLVRAFTQVVAGVEVVKDAAPTGTVAAVLAPKQSWLTKVLVGVVKWIARI
jgi:hypothetical protein